MPNLDDLSSVASPESVNYAQLAQFLLAPLLDNPQSLAVDCEAVMDHDRIWLRVAFDQEDKGKVFGRGGRNLRAIETILNGAVTEPSQKIYLDVYGSHEHHPSPREHTSSSPPRGRRSDGRRGQTSRRPRSPKPSPQLRSPDET
ncbi:KH domain-containing protein [Synechococcus moorigangaii CMS01]|nr:KH domain-containing protein [Synechococcus moorigangaii CMS01]